MKWKISKKNQDIKFLLKQQHCSGPIAEECPATMDGQYKVLKTKNFRINCDNAKDRCVLLNDGTFSVIENIVKFNNTVYFIRTYLQFKTSLYENPDSQQINIHVMDEGDGRLHVIPHNNVSAKVWRIPSSKET